MFAVTSYHLHCFIPNQLLVYLSDKISEFGRVYSIFCSHILEIQVPITAHQLSPNHYLHCPTSSQISSLSYLYDSISELGRIASIFYSHFLDVPITARNQRPSLKPKSFKWPFAERNASPAWAGAPGEQDTDHDGGESGEAAPHI